MHEQYAAPTGLKYFMLLAHAGLHPALPTYRPVGAFYGVIVYYSIQFSFKSRRDVILVAQGEALRNNSR